MARSLRHLRVGPDRPSLASERLSVLDLVPRNVPLSFVHFYDAVIDGDALAASLARTLSSFPSLGGRIVRNRHDGGHRVDHDAGPVSLVIVDDDGPMPRPGPGDGARALLPRLVDTIPAWRLALRGGPLFRARLTRFRDGSVLGVSLSHALADMHGYCLFMQHWAAQHRGEVVVEPVHDRSLVEAHAGAAGRDGVDAHFARLAPADRVRTLSHFAGGYLDSATVTLRIAASSLAALKAEALAGAPGAHLSTHDALSAHLWQRFGGQRRLAPTATSTLTRIVNLRRLADAALPDAYFGNATLAVPASLPHGDVLTASPARRALAVRAATARLDRPRLAAVTSFLADHRRRGDLGAVFPRMDLFRNDFWINDWSRFPVYDLDFGAGRPVWFDLPRVPLPWFAVIAPAPPLADGVDVHLSMPRALVPAAA
jgi:shikimate O-hydroxycinnamoyltransferase